jgi:hypothetical protein
VLGPAVLAAGVVLVVGAFAGVPVAVVTLVPVLAAVVTAERALSDRALAAAAAARCPATRFLRCSPRLRR